jgi:hypothetical protein
MVGRADCVLGGPHPLKEVTRGGLLGPRLTALRPIRRAPQDARKPISLLLVGFGILFIRLGILAWLEKRRDGILRRRGRFQFSIAAMLWAMVVTAIIFGCIRTDNQQRIAVSAFAGYVIVIGYFARRFHVDKRRPGRDAAR